MILLLGAIPPPLGGVAVYCLRRLKFLESNDVEHVYYDSRKKASLVKLVLNSVWMVLCRKKFTIELNVSNPIVLLLFTVLRLNRFTVFIDHNGSRRLTSSSIRKRIFFSFQSNLKAIKIVNNALQENYCDKARKKIELVSPFLPPTEEELNESIINFPSKYSHLLSVYERKIIITTAWKPIDTDDEPDLYGLLDSINIYSKLIPLHSDYIFVLMIGQFDDNELSRKIKCRLKDLSVFDNFIFITGGVSQLPLLDKTRILLRLTKTDGDSVSVREAIYYGSYVIASNVTNRPDGVITVPNGDVNSVLQIIHDLL